VRLNVGNVNLRRILVKNEKQIQVLIPWALLVCIVAVTAFLYLRRDCWNDECHFIEAIRLFITNISLSTLSEYNELAPPFTFILYAVWGRMVGDSLVTFRILSLIIAMVTYYSFYRLFASIFSDRRKAAWLTLFLAANPYMLGASVFVYTDMITMFFLCIFCRSMKDRSPILAGISGAGGLLCRQYFVFIVIAAFGWCLVNYAFKKQRRELAIMGALAICVMPLCACFFLWKGFCPSNFFKTRYMTHGLAFHPNSMTVYIVQMFVYLLPIICLRIKSLYANWTVLITSALLCWVYWIFPVTGSPAAKIKTETIGFFHRLLRSWPGEAREQWVFFICFALALPMLISIFNDMRQRIKSRDGSFPVFIDLSVFAFLFVMPFSYLHWEKYFLPLLPILVMQLMMSGNKEEKHTTALGSLPVSVKQE
jgi:hypothetical protein